MSQVVMRHAMGLSRYGRGLIGAATLVAVVLAWQLVIKVDGIPEVLLPTPSTIASYAWNHSELLWRASLSTLYETVLGFVIALIAGIILAVVMLWSSKVAAALYPLMIMAQVVPKVALAPLFVVYLGFGIQSKVFLSFLISFFPIVINATLGLNATKPEMLELLGTLKASRWQILRKVQLFQAMPYVIAASKVAITLALIGAIVGEFVAGSTGLGYLIVSAGADLNTPLIYSSIVCLTIIGLVLFWAVNLIGQLLMPWERKVPNESAAEARVVAIP